MNRCLLSLAVLAAWLQPTSAVGQSSEPENLLISAYAEPSGTVYLGQQVRLYVEVLTDTWFTTAPRYPEIVVSGVITLQPDRFSSNVTRQRNGRSYSGQRHTYLLYPQRVGELEIPAIAVPLAASANGEAGETVTLKTQALSLTAVMPPGAEKLDSFVTTPRLKVTDSWSGELNDLRTGDALTRKIVVEAESSQALLLPELEFKAPEGLVVYPAPPQLKNTAERGRFSGQRTDSVTYVMEQPGNYSLPAIEIHWWNPESETMNTERLEAVEFSVVNNPDALRSSGNTSLGDELRSLDDEIRWLLDWLSRHLVQLSLALGLIYLLVLVLNRLRPAARAWWRESTSARVESEPYLFDQLIDHCRRSEEAALVDAFWLWASRITSIHGESEEVLLQLAHNSLSPAMQNIAAARYQPGPSKPINRRAVVADLRRLRRTYLERVREPSDDRWADFPLNPPALTDRPMGRA